MTKWVSVDSEAICIGFSFALATVSWNRREDHQRNEGLLVGKTSRPVCCEALREQSVSLPEWLGWAQTQSHLVWVEQFGPRGLALLKI